MQRSDVIEVRVSEPDPLEVGRVDDRLKRRHELVAVHYCSGIDQHRLGTVEAEARDREARCQDVDVGCGLVGGDHDSSPWWVDVRQGARMSSPWVRAAVARSLASRGGRPGGGRVNELAGDPHVRVKSSNPAGVSNKRKRASVESTRKRCSTMRGPNTKSPVEAVRRSSPSQKVRSPSRMYHASSSWWCRWLGEPEPCGACISATARFPDVWSPVVLYVSRPPENQSGSPDPASSR